MSTNPMLERGMKREKAMKLALRRELRRRRMTAKELSTRLGFAEGYLSNVLKPGPRSTRLRIDLLLAVLEVLGIDPMAFLGRTVGARRPPARPAAVQRAAEARDAAGVLALIDDLPATGGPNLRGLVHAAIALGAELAKVAPAAEEPDVDGDDYDDEPAEAEASEAEAEAEADEDEADEADEALRAEAV